MARKLAERLDFKMMEIATALEYLKNAQAGGFTHARLSVARYQAPKPKEAAPEPERGGVPGKIRMNGQPGKVRRV